MIGETMQLVVDLAIGALLGAGVGVAVFGGLAWTLERLADSRAPGRLVLASLLARMAVAALGIWTAATLAGATAVLALAAAAIGVRSIVVTRQVADRGGGG
jgi:hypothetical protein